MLALYRVARNCRYATAKTECGVSINQLMDLHESRLYTVEIEVTSDVAGSWRQSPHRYSVNRFLGIPTIGTETYSFQPKGVIDVT